jgi:hypothetical protein
MAGQRKGEYDRKAIMEQICLLMAEGQSLRRICAAVEGMPKHSTVCGWMLEDQGLSDQYARARQLLGDYRFDEFRDAAAEIVKRYLAEGWEPKDAIAMARLETGNMQWEISKLYPKKYGDKTIHAGDSENPLVVHHKRELTEDELLAIATKA